MRVTLAKARLAGRILRLDALEAALALPRQPYYRTVVEKGAALLRAMVKDHPFVDGNKRIGMASTWLFLLLNGRLLWPSNEEMVRFALELAGSNPAMDARTVSQWVRRYSSRAGGATAETLVRMDLPDVVGVEHDQIERLDVIRIEYGLI